MYGRELTQHLQAAASEYPVVIVTGPRQSGKTTAVKACFPNKPYLNLEAPDIRAFAAADPRRFLASHPQGAILDEIQNVPELLSYIQAEVDERQEEGRYILMGSFQFALHQAISQSLAGRTAVLHLLPMTLNELRTAHIEFSLDEWLIRGFFPRVYDKKINPTKVYRDYVQTYLERDVRQLRQVRDLKMFQNFFRLCASRVGCVLNKDSLSNELGLSHHTVQQWLSILEASYLIIQIPPYFENYGKRIIKSPKLYFTDVGLVTYLLGIEHVDQVSRDPLRGNLIENLVVMELVKSRLNRHLDPQLYYYRDNHQNEVDLIFKQAHSLYPIEIKASQTFHSQFLKGLHYYQKLVGDRASKGYLIYAGSLEQEVDSIQILNYQNASKIVTETGI